MESVNMKVSFTRQLKNFLTFISLGDPCKSSPCKNGATCKSEKDKFTCNCTKGFEGDTCEDKEGKINKKEIERSKVSIC